MADYALVYQLAESSLGKIKDKYILEWFVEVLEATLAGTHTSSYSKFNIEMKLQTLEIGFDGRTCVIAIKDKNTGMGIRIFACEQTQLNDGPVEHEAIIIHVAKMDSLLKKSDSKREYFNTICALLKYWR